MIKRGATHKIADHSYVILDDNVGFVPNVGIVVGERATLIVDTGMGPDNGAIVLEEARKLSDNTEFYLTATHFHPEHDLGATAFPAEREDDSLARPASGDRRDRRADDRALLELLAGRGRAAWRRRATARRTPCSTTRSYARSRRRARAGVRRRAGAHARRHGDVRRRGQGAVDRRRRDAGVPGREARSRRTSRSGSRASREFEAFAPRVVVPAHGRLIDAGTLARYREYLTAVQT